tara:strand:- start:2540 stop:3388 length:849 start_codon:yes stop_codon:yes gene_type:complete
MVASAFLICHHYLKKEFKKNNLSEKIIDDIIFYAVISAILGSKIYFIIETQSFGLLFSNIKNIFYSLITLDIPNLISELQSMGSGLVFNGGLICAIILIAFYVKRHKLDFLELADIITPFILLGHGIGRIGCLLVGDDYGIPSSLPWAIALPNGLPVTSIETFMTHFSFFGYTKEYLQQFLVENSDNIISVHPTQIYEMLLYFSFFYLIMKYKNSINFFKGSIFSIYLITGGLSRFVVEFLRTNERYMFNLSSAQYVSLFMIFAGLTLFYFLRKNKMTHGNN